LTEVKLAPLFDPPTDQRELVRHYTLSEADITMIRQRRGDPNRLGSALMLCYLRYPGRPLQTGEQPAAALVSFVADQIEVFPTLSKSTCSDLQTSAVGIANIGGSCAS
jgi:TnpA family transposase